MFKERTTYIFIRFGELLIMAQKYNMNYFGKLVSHHYILDENIC